MKCKLCKFKGGGARFGDVRASSAELFARVVSFVDSDGTFHYKDVRISLFVCPKCGVIRASDRSLSDIQDVLAQTEGDENE